MNQSIMNAYCHLSEYLAVEVIGSEALKFLNGQLTNQLLNLAPGKPSPNLFCNIKGRIISFIDVVMHQNHIYLILPISLWEKVDSLLNKVALLSKVKFIPQPNIKIYADNHQYYLDLDKDTPLISYEQWKLSQLENMNFEIYPETSGLFLPHELGLEKRNLIDFKKGCYRGQEIIARMHYLAESKYHLVKVLFDHPHSLIRGCDIYHPTLASTIGKMVDYMDEKTLTLCLLRKDFKEEHIRINENLYKVFILK